ncbi:MAG: fumarylacetoacetate hydrolase family protein [Chloroflexi bacterium]|nr:fumarylacetoacetate hydrolase family protein [Chloroflexota bacterium]
MKLVTMLHRNETRLGALIARDAQNYILDLNRAQPDLPADIIRFLQAGDPALAAAQRAIAAADARALISQAEIALLAPVPRPGKIICVGHNYHGHTGATPPAHPDIFAKFNNVVIAPGKPIVIPRASEKVDYEGELAVIIGKRAKYVDQAHALDFVAGYTIFNDVTARDYQNRTSQWTLGKSFDTFGPMGPALVTKDEIPDPGVLELSLTLNGQEMQRANTRQLIFSIPFLIECITQAITLEPGDIISTGTPSGTGASQKPPVFMKPGDRVRVQIEKIGELVNPIVSEK